MFRFRPLQPIETMKRQIIGEGKPKKNFFKFYYEALKKTLVEMLDVSLLKSPSFAIFVLSGAITMMGFFTPFIYLMDRAILNGMDKNKAVWMVSAIGICNTIGRLLCGLISSHPNINTLMVNNIAVITAGASTMVSGLLKEDWFLFLYCCVFGLSIGELSITLISICHL